MHKDKYKNFEELNKHEKRGRDFDIEKVLRKSDFAIIAIHGGGIEPGTTEIARRIAGEDFSFYTFAGKKDKGNFDDLHITSDRFDEPECLELVGKHKKVISIHGEKSKDKEFVIMGGLDFGLRDKTGRMLVDAGFVLKESSNLKGEGATNICNLCASGAGVQLEISKKIRDRLISDKELMGRFVSAVRKASRS